jgi:integrase
MTIAKNSTRLLILPLFQKFIISSRSGRRLTASGKKLSTGTIEQYNCVYKLLNQFEAGAAEQLNVSLVNRCSIRELQKQRLYWKRFYRNFLNFLYKKGFYDQYANSVFKTIKTFFNYLINEKSLPVGNFHKQFVIPSEKLIPVVLEPYQLKYLITDLDFANSLPASLKRTKDIFVFGCTVGLRYSDLLKLKKQNIQYTLNGTYLVLRTHKTAAHVKIPLPYYISSIIEKYKRRSSVYILPQLANSNMNLQLKKVIERAGWTYHLPKIRNRKGNPLEIKSNTKRSFRFCDHITTHTMRRTAITTLLMMGVPETMVRKISGHAAGSKEFYKYVSIAQDYLNKEVINAFEKLLEAS